MLRKAVTFSGMLLNAALHEPMNSADEANDDDTNPGRALVRRFTQLWSKKESQNTIVMNLLSRSVVYLDPYMPEGLRGARNVGTHLQHLIDDHKGVQNITFIAPCSNVHFRLAVADCGVLPS